jgi:AcrR family transcriptional regulator
MAAMARKSRRGDILKCFTEMVAERGYDDVSVRDVAEALEISKGTVLHHFGSKEALLEELNAEYMRRRLAEAREFLAGFADPVDQLQLIIYQLMLSQQDDRAATVAFSREIVRSASEEMMVNVRILRDQYSAIVIEIIGRGVGSGAFMKVDSRLSALQIFGMCNWAWTWFEPGGARSATEIADQYCRSLIGGLTAGPPPKLKGAELANAVEAAMAAHRPDAAAKAAG